MNDKRMMDEVGNIAASWHQVLDGEQIMLLRGQLLDLVKLHEAALAAAAADRLRVEDQHAAALAQVKELLEWKKTATRDLKMVIDANHNQQRVIQNERARVAELTAQLAERSEYEAVDLSDNVPLAEIVAGHMAQIVVEFHKAGIRDTLLLCRWQDGAQLAERSEWTDVEYNDIINVDNSVQLRVVIDQSEKPDGKVHIHVRKRIVGEWAHVAVTTLKPEWRIQRRVQREDDNE